MKRRKSMAINKKEFADRMAEKGGIYKKRAMEAVDLFWDTLMDYMEEGEVVNFYGIGKFEMITTKERIALNPKSGEKVLIHPRKKVRFRPGLYLTDKMEEE